MFTSRKVNKLVRRLSSKSDMERKAAAEALGNLGSPRAVESLIESLADFEWRVSDAAKKALIKLGTCAVDPLIEALGKDEGKIRRAAVEVLGKIGDARAVEPLIIALDDKEMWVRQDAAEALGNLAAPRAVEPLIKALGDDEYFVRTVSAESLGKLGDTHAVDSLIIAISDKNKFVRRAVGDALAKLGGIRLKKSSLGNDSNLYPQTESDQTPIIESLVQKLCSPKREDREKAAYDLIALMCTRPSLLFTCWSEAGRLIRQPHNDSHSDKSQPSDCHTHYDSHYDTGIGIIFPPRPSVPPPDPPKTFESICPKCSRRLALPAGISRHEGECPTCGHSLFMPPQK